MAEQPEDDGGGIDRRRALAYGGLAALAGALGLGAAARLLDDDGAGEDGTPTPTERPPTTAAPAEPTDGRLALVERFAPDIHFGARERWFPTDPRAYASDDGDRRVVAGVDALLAYSRERRDAGGPPRPTVFYDVVPVAGSVVAVQYWLYSVFDQFTVNFHWHDWELLQVFVDEATGEPVLFSASAHARSCPNNEVLRPADARPVVLAEVGSHSSATDVNDRRAHFERLAVGSLSPDVTNAFVRPFDAALAQPFAYGLPRDEGARLPFALPVLDGHPLHSHPALAGLGPADLVPEDVTVADWGDLLRPPTDLPEREPGLVLAAPGSATAADATYALVPLADAAAAIDDFTGPQLSFPFAVPGFVEDRVADHITSAGIPWEDPRATDPAGDVTDPAHRRAVTGEAPAGLTDRVVGAVSTLLGRPDGELDGVDADEHPSLDPYVAVSRFPLPVEVAVLLRSDPVALPTAGGVFRFLDVEAGPHELVVNGPGVAPYAEGFVHDGGTVRPGVDGRVTLVAREDAAVLRADRRDDTGVARVRIVEDLAGPVYDARPVETDRFAVPVHREGRYTVTVTDREGVRGSVRVDPGDLDGEPLPPIETGKASLASDLAVYLAETATVAREIQDGGTADRQRSVPAELDAAAGDAREARDLARSGEAAAANEGLLAVVDRLLDVRRLLESPEAYGYTAVEASLLRSRASSGVDRAEAAYATPVTG